LLTFARKTETVFRPTDVNSLIGELTSLFRETFPKTVCISTDLQQDTPRIVADASQLHQVFMNLCVNARDAMPAGGTITVASRVLDGASVNSRFPKAGAPQYLEIRVSDTGSGMDESTRRKIFDPFFTTKDPGKGTGLGLSMVHSILENHQGMIDVESELGKGTAFRLYFPVDGTAAEAAAAPVPDGRNAPSRGTETVLLIEDEVPIIEMMQAFLGGMGYSVLHARDGEEGVSMFARHRKDIKVVLLDSGLPKIRGDEVANRIKGMDPGARIVLMSGFFDPEVRKNLASLGVDRLIQKPFRFSELNDCLRSVLDMKA
jgi:CheY-like chemotaxis protein